MQKWSSSCLNSKNVGTLPNAFHITVWSQGWRSSCLCQDTVKWEVSTHTTPRHGLIQQRNGCMTPGVKRNNMLSHTCLPFLGKIKGNCFVITNGLRGGREHWESQVLEKSTSWCILPGNVYFQAQRMGFILPDLWTFELLIWILTVNQ